MSQQFLQQASSFLGERGIYSTQNDGDSLAVMIRNPSELVAIKEFTAEHDASMIIKMQTTQNQDFQSNFGKEVYLVEGSRERIIKPIYGGAEIVNPDHNQVYGLINAWDKNPTAIAADFLEVECKTEIRKSVFYVMDTEQTDRITRFGKPGSYRLLDDEERQLFMYVKREDFDGELPLSNCNLLRNFKLYDYWNDPFIQFCYNDMNRAVTQFPYVEGAALLCFKKLEDANYEQMSDLTDLIQNDELPAEELEMRIKALLSVKQRDMAETLGAPLHYGIFEGPDQHFNSFGILVKVSNFNRMFTMLPIASCQCMDPIILKEALHFRLGM